MQVQFSKKFRRQYRKLEQRQQKAVDKALALFWQNPLAPELCSHSLKGAMKGMRAISVTFDLRIVFREEGRYALVYMIQVGSHDEVY